MTSAKNSMPKENEGLSFVEVGESCVLLKSVAKELLGDYQDCWPLVKVLDIGGAKVSFLGKQEVPPIPVHVHSGECVDGSLCGGGKLEAYHFPESPVPLEEGICCRLGFKPGTTKEQVLEALTEFGKSDKMYSLCTEYKVKPGDGWTIRPGIVHSPAPFPTLEMQLPQDDFNMLAYKLGCFVENEVELDKLKDDILFKGLKSYEQVIEQAIDMKGSMDPEFEAHYKREQKELEKGSFGRRMQTFFDEFYGESIEMNANEKYTIEAKKMPYSMLLWRGSVTCNASPINTTTHSEIIVVAGNTLQLVSGEQGAMLYLFFPYQKQEK